MPIDHDYDDGFSWAEFFYEPDENWDYSHWDSAGANPRTEHPPADWRPRITTDPRCPDCGAEVTLAGTLCTRCTRTETEQLDRKEDGTTPLQG